MNWLNRSFWIITMAVTAGASSAAYAGGGEPADRERSKECREAMREARDTRSDHASGRATEKQVRDADAKEEKACRNPAS
jgi:hypothetical protein